MERGGGEGAWSAPRGRRRQRRRRDRDGAPEEQEEERQRRRLQEARAALLDSEFWNPSLKVLSRSVREVLAHRKEVPVPTEEDALLALEELRLSPPALLPGRARLRCVCYGLGNFSSCCKARFQLAFLLLLLKELQLPLPPSLPGRFPRSCVASSILPSPRWKRRSSAASASLSSRGMRRGSAPSVSPPSSTWSTVGKPSTTTSCGATGQQRPCRKWSSWATVSRGLKKGSRPGYSRRITLTLPRSSRPLRKKLFLPMPSTWMCSTTRRSTAFLGTNCGSCPKRLGTSRRSPFTVRRIS